MKRKKKYRFEFIIKTWIQPLPSIDIYIDGWPDDVHTNARSVRILCECVAPKTKGTASEKLSLYLNKPIKKVVAIKTDSIRNESASIWLSCTIKKKHKLYFSIYRNRIFQWQWEELRALWLWKAHRIPPYAISLLPDKYHWQTKNPSFSTPHGWVCTHTHTHMLDFKSISFLPFVSPLICSSIYFFSLDSSLIFIIGTNNNNNNNKNPEHIQSHDAHSSTPSLTLWWILSK